MYNYQSDLKQTQHNVRYKLIRHTCHSLTAQFGLDLIESEECLDDVEGELEGDNP